MEVAEQLVQRMSDEIKRLRRVNEQQASGWKSTAEQLRDANLTISVLEAENLELVHEIETLTREVNPLKKEGGYYSIVGILLVVLLVILILSLV